MGREEIVPWGRLLLAVAGCVILATHTCTGEAAFEFCENAQPVSDTTIDMTFGNGVDGEFQCTCAIAPTTPTALLSFQMRLGPASGNSLGAAKRVANLTLSCEPFAAIHWGQHSQLEQCVGPTASQEVSRFLVRAEQEEVTVTLHNHHRRPLEAHVRVTVEAGHVSVRCYPMESSDPWLGDTCPCDNAMISPVGGDPDIFNRADVGTNQTGLAVGLVCVAIFLIVLAIIAGVWWYRKREGSSGEKDLERVTAGNSSSVNPAFVPSSTTASRASGMDRPGASDPHYANVPGDRSQPMPFDAEPELDLSLRTAPQGKGSKDSGMYSMPADKPPNNNCPQFTHSPLGPDQMYNPMLAKQPSVASLTGQGALHGSVDHLNSPDPLYAAPIKKSDRQPPPPQRSASQDALNTNAPPRGDLAAARSRSHNASKSSIASGGSVVETDV